MKASPELAKRMIRTQGLRRLVCFTPDRSDVLFRAEGSPDELCEAVDEVVAMVAGPFRLEADTPRPRDEKGRERAGRTPDGARPIVLVVMGTLGAPQSSAVDAALSARLDRLESLLLARAEEEEEEEEEEQGAAIAERVLSLLEKHLEGKAPAPAAKVAAPVSGPVGPVADSRDDARAMAAALANLKASDPQAFAMYKAHLLENYGPKN